MYEDAAKFPAQSSTELVLNAQDIQAIRKESKDPIQAEINCYFNIQNLPEEAFLRLLLVGFETLPISGRPQS